jgi:PhnB protein
MAIYNPYLHFPGNTEEAFHFYKSIIGGEFIKYVKYKDMPPSIDYQIAPEHLEKIMFISLPLGNGNILMGSDAILETEDRKFTFGDNFHIAISTANKAEADNLFNGLATGGSIQVPITDSPWEAYFGMLVDKFGVQWTIEYDPKENNI